MKCNNCGAEWNVGNSKSIVTKCPFCGESLIQDLQETLEEVTMSSVLQQIVKQFGLEIFTNNSKCISIFKDLAPGLKKEQRWLGMALEDYDIVSYFINCEEKDRKQHISKAIYAMEADLAETAQKEILTAFVSVFGWDEALLQEYFKDNVKSDDEVTAKQDTENTLMKQNSAIVSEEAELLYQEGEMYYHGHGVEKNFAKARYYYQKAAEQGHAEAQNSCANMYYNGEGVAQDYRKAAEWYRKAAEQGHAKAQNTLGAMCLDGEGVTKDYHTALVLFQNADKQGNMHATFNLGLMYQNGWGVNRNNETARAYYEKAVARGYTDAKKKLDEINEIIYSEKIVDAEAQYQEGEKYYNKKDYERAVKWYRKAAGQGHAEAQSKLGDMYYDGQGIENDYYKAVEWYRKAAEQGLVWPQFRLGWMYDEGLGVSQDYSKSMEYYQKAVKQGYAMAQNNLGVMYLDGKGIDKDYRTAFHLFQKADEQKNMHAPWNLGLMYERGLGVYKNLDTAKCYYEKAAERGHTNAKKKVEEINNLATSGRTIYDMEVRIKRLRQSFDDAFWRSCYGHVAVLDLIPPKKAQKVVSTYAKNTGINVGDIKVMFDTTAFGGGDKGLILTYRYIISSEGKKLLPLSRISHLKIRIPSGIPDPEKYKITVSAIEHNGTEHQLIILDNEPYYKDILKKINELVFDTYLPTEAEQSGSEVLINHEKSKEFVNIKDPVKQLREAFAEDFWNSHKGDVAVLELVSLKKARNVVTSYAKNTNINIADIRILFDATIFGSGKDGLILTDQYIIGSKGKELLPLSTISYLKTEITTYSGGFMVFAVEYNGKAHPLAELYNNQYNKDVLEKINELIFNIHIPLDLL